MTQSTRRKDEIIRSDTYAGRSSAISKPFWIWVSERRVVLEALISHRFPIEDATKAYDLISGGEASLGVLLEYPDPVDAAIDRKVSLYATPAPREGEAAIAAGFIGAGNYASRVLIPAYAETPVELRSVCSATGVSSAAVGRKHGIGSATTDPQIILDDAQINLVVIATRHDTHADYVCRALAAGKHVFVGKTDRIERR